MNLDALSEEELTMLREHQETQCCALTPCEITTIANGLPPAHNSILSPPELHEEIASGNFPEEQKSPIEELDCCLESYKQEAVIALKQTFGVSAEISSLIKDLDFNQELTTKV